MDEFEREALKSLEAPAKHVAQGGTCIDADQGDTVVPVPLTLSLSLSLSLSSLLPLSSPQPVLLIQRPPYERAAATLPAEAPPE